MANDIKQKIVLDGEKEYKQALKDAQRELRTLKSELKAETAELGKNATEQDKQAVKVKNLQKQIAEQEKIVRTYAAALEEVREKYGDNQDEIAKWEIKLNDARTALANMKSGLEDVGQGFQKVAGDAQLGVVAAESFAQAFEGLGSLGDSVSGAIEDIFGGVLDIIRDTVGELWDTITETAAKANNWTDLANYFGSTAEEVQVLNAAINESRGDFSKFTNLVSQLSFGGKNKKITEWFGISDANYTNNVEYTMAVLDAMSQAYKEWGTGGKWDNAMTDIFGGKKSADVSWFVTNLDTILAKRKELEENGGYLMSDDELATMNEAHVMLGTIDEKWELLKRKFAAGFGTTTLSVATNVSGALDAIAKYFDADTDAEREKALDDLEKNITEAFETIGEALELGIQALDKVADNLKESENPIVRTLGTLLDGAMDVLTWLTEDNAHNLVSALEIIAGFWIVGKGLKMVSIIGELVGHLVTIKSYGGLKDLMGLLSGGAAGSGAGAAGAGAAGAGAAGAGAAGAGAAGAGAAGGSFWGKAAGFVLKKALPVGIGVGLVVNDSLSNHGDENQWTEEEIKESQEKNSFTESDRRAGEQAALHTAMWDGKLLADQKLDVTDAQREAAEAFWDVMRESDGDFSDEAWDRFEKAFEGEDEVFDQLLDMMDYYKMAIHPEDWADQTDIPADWWKKGSDENGVTSEDIQSLNALPGAVKAAVQEVAGSIVFKLDGEQVAWLLAPRVSQFIARDIEP